MSHGKIIIIKSICFVEQQTTEEKKTMWTVKRQK